MLFRQHKNSGALVHLIREEWFLAFQVIFM